jgi:mannitol/fructose-specific phosphotransferase system IIA component (Ntr-type)
MNARGAMEIILGLLALRFQLISEKLFVALVFMAIVTSLVSGPLMQKILRLKKPRRFIEFVPMRSFVRLSANNSEKAILELSESIGTVNGLKMEDIIKAVLKREQLMPTGIGNEIAVPHARMKGISYPVVAVGIAHEGIDFHGPDGKPARLIFLILTPFNDNGAQVEILADIARTFRAREFRKAAISASGMTEFLAIIKCTEKN